MEGARPALGSGLLLVRSLLPKDPWTPKSLCVRIGLDVRISMRVLFHVVCTYVRTYMHTHVRIMFMYVALCDMILMVMHTDKPGSRRPIFPLRTYGVPTFYMSADRVGQCDPTSDLILSASAKRIGVGHCRPIHVTDCRPRPYRVTGSADAVGPWLLDRNLANTT